MVTARTGKMWLKRIGDKAYYAPELEPGKHYILINAFVTKNGVECFTFEEVEVSD